MNTLIKRAKIIRTLCKKLNDNNKIVIKYKKKITTFKIEQKQLLNENQVLSLN